MRETHEEALRWPQAGAGEGMCDEFGLIARYFLHPQAFCYRVIDSVSWI